MFNLLAVFLFISTQLTNFLSSVEFLSTHYNTELRALDKLVAQGIKT